MIDGFVVEVIKDYKVTSNYSIDPHYAVDRFAGDITAMEENDIQSVSFRKTSSNQATVVTPTSAKPKWAVVICPPGGEAIVSFYYTDLTEEVRKNHFEQLKVADKDMLAISYNMQTRRITDRLNGYFDGIQYWPEEDEDKQESMD